MFKKIDNRTKKQIKRFIVAGCGAVGTDTSVYFLLVNFAYNHIGYDLAKFISFLSGTLLAFIINKFWTFESKRKSIYEVIVFLLLYLATLGLNVSMNHIVLRITDNLIIAAFIVATGCSTIANFLGQKFWVFKGMAS